MKKVFLVLLIFFSILFSTISYAETTYGPTWEETCDNGVCTRTLYSGYSPSYFENNLTNLASLKGYYNKVYLKYDNDHDIIINDFNKTWIDFNLTFDGNYSEYEYEVSDNKIKTKFKIGYPNGTEIEYEVELEDNKTTTNFVLDNVLEYNYTLGENSTTVQLQDADSENLDDCEVDEQFPDITGDNTGMGVGSSNEIRTYIKFNISSIPSSVIITNATLFMNQSSSITTSEWVAVYHVIDYNWTSHTTGINLTEHSMTWNNQTCGANFDNSTHCNLTMMDNDTSISFGVWDEWNVLIAVNNEYNNGDKNVSFVLRGDLTPVTEANYYSKEWGTIASRPYLNVTYVTSYPQWYNNQSSIVSEYNPNTLSQFNITWNDTNFDIDDVFLEINLSSGTTNYTATNDTYEGDIYNYSIILPVGNYYWKSYANNTDGDWNTSDEWTFTIAKNTSNPIHLNTSNDNWATNTTDANFSGDMYDTFYLNGYLGYPSSGLALLYIDGSNFANPYSDTLSVKTHTIKTNTTGNANYSANGTGVTYYVTVTSSTTTTTGGGGGGGVASIIEFFICPVGQKYDQETQKCVPMSPEELDVLPPIYEIESFFLNPIVGPLSLFHLALLGMLGYFITNKKIVKGNKLIVVILVLGVLMIMYISLQVEIDSYLNNILDNINV